MTDKEHCTECDSVLVGGDIPYDIVEHYIPLNVDKDEWLSKNPWPTWKRKVGIEVRGAYDGVLIWQCPDCKHMWPRFQEWDWESMYHRALTHIEIIKEQRVY